MGGRGAKAGIDNGISTQIEKIASGEMYNAPLADTEAVERIMTFSKKDDGFRDNAKMYLDMMRTGAEITVYAPMFDERGNEIPGTVSTGYTFKKQEDGRWKSLAWYHADRLPDTSGDIARRLRDRREKLAAGRIDVSSSVQVTGREGKAYNGLRYAKGTFDVIRHDDKIGRIKDGVTGSITTYDGVKYGVARDPYGGYAVTHIPTGLRINGREKLKTLNDVSNHIKSMSSYIERNKDFLKKQEEQFNNTTRKRFY